MPAQPDLQSQPDSGAGSASASQDGVSVALQDLPAPKPGPGKLCIQGLTKRFGDHTALEPLNLEVGPSGITGLLGPNGSGKSTLMRMLFGLTQPSGGSANVDGVPLQGDGLAIRKRATYLAGEVATYGELKGRDHLRWLLRNRGEAALEKAKSIAGELGLPLQKRVHTYSHGMKRQMLFSAALAPDVPVRILDEASEGLDPTKRRQLLDLLRADAASGTTILLSSHHLGEVEEACDRIVFLSHGKLLAVETTEAVRQRASTLLRLTWPADTDLDELERAWNGTDGGGSPSQAHKVGMQTVERLDRRADGWVVHLASGDPRTFLRFFASLPVPQPETIEYGKLSLRELYRDLYGVEGT